MFHFPKYFTTVLTRTLRFVCVAVAILMSTLKSVTVKELFGFLQACVCPFILIPLVTSRRSHSKCIFKIVLTCEIFYWQRSLSPQLLNIIWAGRPNEEGFPINYSKYNWMLQDEMDHTRFRFKKGIPVQAFTSTSEVVPL